MIHEPRRLLRDLDSSVNLVRIHAVFAVHNLPHGKQPLVQAQRRVFKDRSSLGGKLPQGVLAATLPTVVLSLEQNLRASATRTGNAVRPPMRDKILTAIIGAGEVENRILKRVRFHGLIYRRTAELSTILLPNGPNPISEHFLRAGSPPGGPIVSPTKYSFL